MRKRTLSIVLVVLALLFNAWGNVLAAAVCPMYSLNRDCCRNRGVQRKTESAKHTRHESSCHHEMAGMTMDDMVGETASSSGAPASGAGTPDSRAQITTESSTDQFGLDLPAAQCVHCQIHSQTTSETVSVAAIDPAKRLVESASLPADFAAGLTRIFTDLTLPPDHGPPGALSPRHVIINVFRI
jgi:hypothetical protein